jgi:acyl carrier protein
LPTHQEIRDRLVQEVAASTNMPIDRVNIREPFASYSIASIEAVQLIGVLETWLGLTLDATLLWEYSTIEVLARHLAQAVGANS